MTVRPLDIPSLSTAYAAGLDPAVVLIEIQSRIAEQGARPVWITVVPLDNTLERLAEVRRRRDAGEVLPLYGIPFAVKDNIDVAGMPTTAACPAFAYTPARSATVVERLEAAGAILIGKTNLDQFATGLVGTRSPYGIPTSVFDPAYISGGSSSGSAVAVAAGMASFALGTDTAGSGRVPAAFNNIVGLKPSKGWLSTRGVLPACRSQDCVSVFAATAEDALRVADVAGGFDAEEPFSRPLPAAPVMRYDLGSFRFGVPRAPLEFFGDREAQHLFDEAVGRLERLGGTRVAIDLQPFLDAAKLLYAGPWVAERLAAIKDFAGRSPEAIHPVVAGIILPGAARTAVEAFEGVYRLAELTRRAEAEWAAMDVLLLPTAGTTYTIEAVLADPVRLNSNLGLYTNFVNLMDLSAIAVPAGFRPNGLPFGVTLMGRAFDDAALGALGSRLHRALDGATVGATGQPLPPVATLTTPAARAGFEIAVVGAHLSGQPLNHQLVDLGARLVRTTRTAGGYSLYALAASTPAKPGLVRDGRGKGGIEVEVWTMPNAGVAAFLAAIPAPLGIGTLALADGTSVKGFLCEAHAVAGAEDITRFGGWRAYLQRVAALP